MSTYYPVYLEAFVNERWVLINPAIKDISDGDYSISPIMEKSASWFSEAWDRITERGIRLSIEDISTELHEIIDPDGAYDNPQTDIWSCSTDILNNIGYAHAGFVLKETLNSFSNGNIEAMYPVDLNEVMQGMTLNPVNGIGEIFDRLYVYHEWDNPDDPEYILKRLKNLVDMTVDLFMESNYMFDIPKIRLVVYWV